MVTLTHTEKPSNLLDFGRQEVVLGDIRAH
jgi:hypothetical protein